MAAQNHGNREVNQHRPQSRHLTVQGNQDPNMVKESCTFKEAVTQGDMSNILIGIAGNQGALSQLCNGSAKEILELSLKILLNCGPSGEWEVKWAGEVSCETMGPSYS